MLKWLWESLFFIKIIFIFDFFLFHKDKKFGQNYIPQIFFITKDFYYPLEHPAKRAESKKPHRTCT